MNDLIREVRRTTDDGDTRTELTQQPAPTRPKSVSLPVASLVVDDPDLHIRVTKNGDHLAMLIDAFKEGSPVPPIVVVHDGSAYRVVDGFYRVKAACIAGLKVIEAKVLAGGKRDAILMACGMNATQFGLPRSRADKHRAVEVLLADEKWSKWSDSEIAKACGVSAPFVAKMKKQLTPNVSSERSFRNKHGSESTMDTSNIGKRQSPKTKSASPEASTNSTDAVMSAPVGAVQPRQEKVDVLEVIATKPETDPVIISRPDVTTLLAAYPDANLQVAFEFVASGGLRLRLSLVGSDASATREEKHAEVAA